MQIVSVNCPSCGGFYGGRVTSKFITCEYCGSRFALSKDELIALGFEDADGDGYDDGDTPDKHAREASVPAYAGSLCEYARDQCAEFLDKNKDDQSTFRSTDKVLRGLNIQHEDEVYLIHDDTLFGSGKNGFAVTDSGMYCREFGDGSAHFVSWDDFTTGSRPELDDSYVRQDETSICYLTGDEELRHQLFDMFRRLWDYAQSA